MNWPSVRWPRAARSRRPAPVLAPILAIVLVLVVTPGREADAFGPRRLDSAKEVLVAAVGAWEETNQLAWQGLELAAREINASGGLLGKPLTLWRREAPADTRQAVVMAQRIAENPAVAMTILCSAREVALPVSTILAYYDVLTFITGESTPFYEVNLPLLFRLCPTDADEMRHLALFCLYKGIKRVAVFVSNNDFAKIHANTFETAARARGMEIVSRVDLETDESLGALRRDLADLAKNRRFDAIFYSGPPVMAVRLIHAAAAQGLRQPFIGGSQWDTPELAEAADPVLTSVYIVTPFAPDLPGRPAQRFIEAYRQAYGEPPDALAAINYNALYLYAAAARAADSADPDKVTASLTRTLRWRGPTGEIRLNELGELISPPLYIKRFSGGTFGALEFDYPLHWH